MESLVAKDGVSPVTCCPHCHRPYRGGITITPLGQLYLAAVRVGLRKSA